MLRVSGSIKQRIPPMRGMVPYNTIGMAELYASNSLMRGARMPPIRAHVEFSPTPLCLEQKTNRL